MPEVKTVTKQEEHEELMAGNYLTMVQNASYFWECKTAQASTSEIVCYNNLDILSYTTLIYP